MVAAPVDVVFGTEAAVLGVGGDDVDGGAAVGVAEEEVEEVVGKAVFIPNAADLFGGDGFVEEVGEELLAVGAFGGGVGWWAIARRGIGGRSPPYGLRQGVAFGEATELDGGTLGGFEELDVEGLVADGGDDFRDFRFRIAGFRVGI